MNNPFEHHPWIGFLVTVFHLACGSFLFVQRKMMIVFGLPILHIHLPPIIGELLQNGAWFVAICCGCLSGYGSYKKYIKGK